MCAARNSVSTIAQYLKLNPRGSVQCKAEFVKLYSPLSKGISD